MTFNIPPTKLIHIDIEAQEIGRNYKTEIGAVMWYAEGHRTPNTVAIPPQKLANIAGFSIPEDRPSDEELFGEFYDPELEK